MALTNNGTSVEIQDSQLPSEYVKPSITKFNDYEYRIVETISVAKASVENANAATTFGNLIDDAIVGITKQVSNIVSNDFDVTNTVDCYAELVAVTTNADLSGVLYTNGAVNYLCSVRIYIKTS